MTEMPNEKGAPHSESPALVALTNEEIARQQGADFNRMVRQLTPRVYVAPLLVAANVIAFVAMVASGVPLVNPTAADLLKWGANFGPKVFNGEEWRVLTCMFAHFGIVHILLNMFFLGTVGPLVERLVGSVGFFVLYFAAGLGGSLVSLCWDPLVVGAGASGAIFGVYGALLAVLRQKVGQIPEEVLKRLWKGTLTFVGMNIVLGFLMPGVGNAAHIGGLAVGFLCGVVLNLPLAPESRAKRPARIVLAAVVGSTLVCAGFVVANARYAGAGEAVAELDQFDRIEKHALDTYNAALAKVERGEMTDTAFADVLERDLLPEWRTSREKIAALKKVPADLEKGITQLLNYMRLRQESWELSVQAIRERDPEKMERAHAKQNAAEEAVKKMNAPKK